jgi:uncharacterized hydrophobic protein (TIGR00271 family)
MIGTLVPMLHLRMIIKPELSGPVVDRLLGDPAVTHVVVLPGAARQPPGDVILCDVVREGANAVLANLRSLGVPEHGSIAVETVDVAISSAANRAADEAPGEAADAVVWDEIEHKIVEETRLTATFVVFLAVATMIAGIGVLLDQPILIVGAMVVGPEFGPLAALCLGMVRRRRRPVVDSLVALGVGFPAAMVATVLFTWALTAIGLVDRSMLLAERPLTGFIWRPDALSWVVGFLAGIAGMLSLTSAKSGALIGVLISVTTVPAAANAAVAIAYGELKEAGGSALQLFINVAAIVTAGVLTLLVQRRWWPDSVLAPGRSTGSGSSPGPP